MGAVWAGSLSGAGPARSGPGPGVGSRPGGRGPSAHRPARHRALGLCERPAAALVAPDPAGPARSVSTLEGVAEKGPRQLAMSRCSPPAARQQSCRCKARGRCAEHGFEISLLETPDGGFERIWSECRRLKAYDFQTLIVCAASC